MTRLVPADLLPIVSWVALRGAAGIAAPPSAPHISLGRQCAEPSFCCSPLISAGTAVLAPYLFWPPACLPLSIVDFRLYRLPDRDRRTLTVLVVAAFAVVAALDGEGHKFVGDRGRSR